MKRLVLVGIFFCLCMGFLLSSTKGAFADVSIDQTITPPTIPGAPFSITSSQSSWINGTCGNWILYNVPAISSTAYSMFCFGSISDVAYDTSTKTISLNYNGQFYNLENFSNGVTMQVGSFSSASSLAPWSFNQWSFLSASFTIPGLYPPQLTVTLNPQAGGTVTSNPASDFSCTSNPCTGHFSGDIQLAASTSAGWSFASWNDGTINSTDNPLAVAMNSDKNLTANFSPILGFPLSGTLAGRGTPLMLFGDMWTFGECPTGTYKKHAGLDLQASATEAVFSAHAGTVREIFTGEHSQWADAIVIEDDNGQYTTLYWHINSYGNISVGSHVTKGQ